MDKKQRLKILNDRNFFLCQNMNKIYQAVNEINFDDRILKDLKISSHKFFLIAFPEPHLYELDAGIKSALDEFLQSLFAVYFLESEKIKDEMEQIENILKMEDRSEEQTSEL